MFNSAYAGKNKKIKNMIRCSNCKSIKVKILDLNFAKNKNEGEHSDKSDLVNNYFWCETCRNSWYDDPEAEKLYFEYIQLKNETTLAVQDTSVRGTYTPQYLDPNKLERRKNITKELVSSYQHILNIGPGEWYEIHQDAKI